MARRRSGVAVKLQERCGTKRVDSTVDLLNPDVRADISKIEFYQELEERVFKNSNSGPELNGPWRKVA